MKNKYLTFKALQSFDAYYKFMPQSLQFILQKVILY